MFNRIVSSVASRLPATSAAKRDLVTTAFWHIQDVAYARLREAGFMPGGILDIGAHDGRWAAAARAVYPEPHLLMIDARGEETTKLRAKCRQHPNTDFEIAMLGPSEGQAVEFSVHGSASSAFPERSNAPRKTKTMTTTTLDKIVSGRSDLKAPLFLKLDVQGGELEVLKGGTETMARTEVIQLEVALLDYNEGGPRCAETVAFMDQRGFVVYDVAGFVRPKNIALTHLDMLFVRNGSKLRPSYFAF
jgi:FkbM family methyltransferase